MKRPIPEPLLRVAEKLTTLTWSEMMDLSEAIFRNLENDGMSDCSDVAMVLQCISEDIKKAAALDAEKGHSGPSKPKPGK